MPSGGLGVVQFVVVEIVPLPPVVLVAFHFVAFEISPGVVVLDTYPGVDFVECPGLKRMDSPGSDP